MLPLGLAVSRPSSKDGLHRGLTKGPSSETQNAMGTGLFGGMITATVLAVLFVPVFFASIMRFAECKTLHQAAGAVRQ
ncbi:efflux RND transporter permease subunit [Shinella sp.]|uniref:efflux RND transporter permease subunit n=1 Tax=Shinella sp. TaxID=1870904 RepID=UPI0028B0161F|nr:efflux RND transporter permease subunit [Shinella sp.]